MQKAITVTRKVTVTLGRTGNLTAYIPAGMKGKSLKNIYAKNAIRFSVAHQVLVFNDIRQTNLELGLG